MSDSRVEPGATSSAGAGRLRDAPEERLGTEFWWVASLWLASVVLLTAAGAANPFHLGMLVSTSVGGLVAWQRPRNAVGWLLLADGLVWLMGSALASQVEVVGTPGSPAIAAVAAYDTAGWVVAVGLVPVTVLVFPSGRLPAGWWRRLGWLLIGAGTVACANLVTPGPLPSWPQVDNPFGIHAAALAAPILASMAEPVFFLAGAVALGSVVVRFRRSKGIERQQLGWLVAAAGLIVVGALLSTVLSLLGVPGAWIFHVAPLSTVSVAVGIAVLRYRLWDLDLVVVGTLVYALVAVLVTAVYAVIVGGLGVLLGRGVGDVWLGALATAIVAALYQPAREASQAATRRLLQPGNGAAGSPAVRVRTLGGFRVERRGEPLDPSAWQSRKARQLLRMLVAGRGRPVHREQLIDALWPGESSDRLANRLAVAVSTLRSVFDPEKAYPNDHFVAGTADTLWLDHVVVDVEMFLATAQAGLRKAAPSSPRPTSGIGATSAWKTCTNRGPNPSARRPARPTSPSCERLPARRTRHPTWMRPWPPICASSTSTPGTSLHTWRSCPPWSAPGGTARRTGPCGAITHAWPSSACHPTAETVFQNTSARDRSPHEDGESTIVGVRAVLALQGEGTTR